MPGVIQVVNGRTVLQVGENTAEAARQAGLAAASAEDAQDAAQSVGSIVTRANPQLGDAKWNRGFSAATAVSFSDEYTWTVGNSGNYVRESNLVGDQLTAEVLHGVLDIVNGDASTITLRQYNGSTPTSAAVNLTVNDGQAFITFTRDASCNRVRFTVSTGATETITFSAPRVGIGKAARARNDRLLLVSEAWDAFSGSSEKPTRVMSNLVKQAGAGVAGVLASDGLTATVPQDTTHRFDVSLDETLTVTDQVFVMVKLSTFVNTVTAAPVASATTGSSTTLAYFRDGWWYGTFPAVAGGNGADAVRVTVTNSDFGGSAASVDVSVQSVLAFPRTSKMPPLLETPGVVRETIENALAGTFTWSQSLIDQMRAPRNAEIYFVDPYTGADSNDGLSEDAAFRTVTKLRDTLQALPNFAVAYACVRRGTYLQQTLDIRSYIGANGTYGHELYVAFETGCTLRWLDPTQSTHPSGSRNNGIQYGDHPSGFLKVWGNGLLVTGFSAFTGNSVGAFGADVYVWNVRSEDCQDGFTSHGSSDMYLYGCSTGPSCSKAAMENVGSGHTVAVGCTFEGAVGASKGIISLPTSESVTADFDDCQFIAATADQTMDLNNGVTIDGGVLGDPAGFRISVISTDNAYTIGGATDPVLSNYTEALG